MAETPTSDREKVSACVEVRGRHSHWIEIEVQDDARDEIGDIPLDIQGSQLSRAARARSYPPW